MNPLQLSFWDVVEPNHANGNGRADPFADLIFSLKAYYATEADTADPARAPRCTCTHPLDDADPDRDRETNCIFCGRTLEGAP